jgi:hypothetical protein
MHEDSTFPRGRNCPHRQRFECAGQEPRVNRFSDGCPKVRPACIGFSVDIGARTVLWTIKRSRPTASGLALRRMNFGAVRNAPIKKCRPPEGSRLVKVRA